MSGRPIAAVFAAAFIAGAASGTALAAGKYDPGASDTEIKIGQTMPYSGPASVYGTIGKSEAAYFRMINEQGGIKGRKINLLSEDDGYSPPKTVEQARKLVEEDQVLFLLNPLGTPPNTAIQKYMNAKQVPQLFVATGASKWGDPQHFPWTMGWQPTYRSEAIIYAKYIMQHQPNAKIGILYQADDYGRDYLDGLTAGLGDKAKTMIIKQVSYEATDPTIDSQVITLQGTGADVFLDFSGPKQVAQAIRRLAAIGWHPLQIINSVSVSVSAVMVPAGPENAVGIISTAYVKDPTDPQWKDDKDTQTWLAWMKQYYPAGNIADVYNAYGYSIAQTAVQVLRQCGDDLTRANVMKQAASLQHFKLPMLLPGIEINTSASNFYPIRQMELMHFDGKTWVLSGEILSD
ncbi:MAG TPA: ABC transporter substrate-binding protein [Candidatus Cybelea sp.]|nr:ABC transporter substrate-binding protein [Candidatus Cybelea sp.]